MPVIKNKKELMKILKEQYLNGKEKRLYMVFRNKDKLKEEGIIKVLADNTAFWEYYKYSGLNRNYPWDTTEPERPAKYEIDDMAWYFPIKELREMSNEEFLLRLKL